MIEPLLATDVPQVVRLHISSFPGFFLSFLGPRFLRLYYESIADYSQALGLVYRLEEPGQPIVGFVCGTLGPARFYSYLIRTRLLRFALAAAGAALRKPSIVPRLVRALTYPSQTTSAHDSATLTSIAVDPEVQQRGVGSALMKAFLEAMRARGVRSVYLTTDRDHNQPVNDFYRRHGFRIHQQYVTPEGRAMNEYLIELAEDLS